jgi:hypothetical protein
MNAEQGPIVSVEGRSGEPSSAATAWVVRRAERSALRSDRPKRRTIALRASVGSTEASASLLARVGVVGPTRTMPRMVSQGLKR